MRPLLIALSFLFVTRIHAQELVTNGDFESYTQCPDYVSQIGRATGWSRPTEGTSDYLNACLGMPFSLSVPGNQFGTQAAHSGNGYAGFYCFYGNQAAEVPGNDDREYVTHGLASPLVPGRTYAVEFFVSLADVSKYAVNDIGALLSMQVPTRTDEFAIEHAPQITNTTQELLDDKTGWMRINGCFVADSAYAYITIGNFHDAASTQFTEVPTNYPLTYFSYYYVDDVSVQALDPPELGPDITSCTAVQLMVQDPIPGAIYNWSTGEVGTSIQADSSGTYTVWMDAGGCLLADSMTVLRAEELAINLPADTAVDFCTTNTFALALEGLPPGSTVQWSTGESTPAIRIIAAGTYHVSAQAPGHCATSASITVIDTCSTPLYAPNAFTPDGDGINDLWRPFWIASPDTRSEFTIYDRWGGVLFHSDSQDAAWDGTANGAPLPVGIYNWTGWTRRTASGAARDQHGHLFLIR